MSHGVIYGVLYVLGVVPGTYWYNFWSAFGSGPLAWCVLPLVYYRHHICHRERCYRLGHPVNGVVKCRKHLFKGEAVTASAQGEDRSEFQPVSNWNGLDFGFVKATEGTSVIDPHFRANWANLKAEGKPRGAYHFFHPGEDIHDQARLFVATLTSAGLEAGDMLVVDSELPSGAKGAEAMVSGRQVVPASEQDQAATAAQVDVATKAFLDEVRTLLGEPAAAEHPLIVYTMHSVGQNLTETAKAYPLVWFAWPSRTAPPAELIAPWTSWLFWQWGQSGDVDKDAFDGTADELHAFIKRYLPKPPPKVIHWRVTTITSLAKVAPRHHMTPEQMIALAARQGHKYGPAMARYIRTGNWNARLPMFTTLYAYAKETA